MCLQAGPGCTLCLFQGSPPSEPTSGPLHLWPCLESSPSRWRTVSRWPLTGLLLRGLPQPLPSRFPVLSAPQRPSPPGTSSRLPPPPAPVPGTRAPRLPRGPRPSNPPRDPKVPTEASASPPAHEGVVCTPGGLRGTRPDRLPSQGDVYRRGGAYKLSGAQASGRGKSPPPAPRHGPNQAGAAGRGPSSFAGPWGLRGGEAPLLLEKEGTAKAPLQAPPRSLPRRVTCTLGSERPGWGPPCVLAHPSRDTSWTPLRRMKNSCEAGVPAAEATRARSREASHPGPDFRGKSMPEKMGRECLAAFGLRGRVPVTGRDRAEPGPVAPGPGWMNGFTKADCPHRGVRGTAKKGALARLQPA